MVAEGVGSETGGQGKQGQKQKEDSKAWQKLNLKTHETRMAQKRKEAQKKLGDAVERRWSSIERAWDKAAMHLPDKTSVQKEEIPLMIAEAFLKKTIQTTEHMTGGLLESKPPEKLV